MVDTFERYFTVLYLNLSRWSLLWWLSVSVVVNEVYIFLWLILDLVFLPVIPYVRQKILRAYFLFKFFFLNLYQSCSLQIARILLETASIKMVVFKLEIWFWTACEQIIRRVVQRLFVTINFFLQEIVEYLLKLHDFIIDFFRLNFYLRLNQLFFQGVRCAWALPLFEHISDFIKELIFLHN